MPGNPTVNKSFAVFKIYKLKWKKKKCMSVSNAGCVQSQAKVEMTSKYYYYTVLQCVTVTEDRHMSIRFSPQRNLLQL